MKKILIWCATSFFTGTVLAAGSAPVTVVNNAGNPVPITGSVTIKGDVAGGLQSVDENVTLFDDFIEVTYPFFGNHNTPFLNVKAYKEVRVVVERGSCTGCGDPISAAVVVGSSSSVAQIDTLMATNEGVGIGYFVSRTYTVPGDRMAISLKAAKPGTTNTVHVFVSGRAN